MLKRVQAIEAQAQRGPSLRNATVMSFQLYLQHRCKFEKAKRSQTRPQKDSVAQKSKSEWPHAFNRPRKDTRFIYVIKGGVPICATARAATSGILPKFTMS